MPTKIGQYEIQSDLSKSSTGAVYKANDSESGQTVALKTIQLSAFGEQAAALEQALQTEIEAVKVLSSQNLTLVSNPAVIDGQFCATMEYVQGNSIATMLARGEGFSIWDLLDIGRQLCGGLDHASSHQIAHYSLEPSKIMCGWDGTVKILSFGLSSVGNFVQHPSGEASSILYYMSPEQLRGETLDMRSNLFSLGAIFYQMVTERKAFDGADTAAIRQNILESTPVAPIQLNAKVHPLLSDLIMKTLAKDPGQRYQNGRSLLDDLEKCKENRPAATKAPAAKSPLSANVNAAAQAKFAAPAAARPQPPKLGAGLGATPSAPPARTAAPPRPVARVQSAISRPVQPASKPTPAVSKLAQPASRLATPKSAAAAAGVGASSSAAASQIQDSDDSILLDLTSGEETPSAYMSAAATEEPQVETFEPAPSSPKIAVDPMMAGGGAGNTGGTSFSDISELPPLKEVYVAPPPPPPAEEEPVIVAPPTATVAKTAPKKDAKPRIQPRQVASKAIKEVKGVPPQLMMYSLGVAAVLILAIGIGVMLYIHGQSSEDDAGASRPAPAAVQTVPEQAPVQQPEAAQPTTPQEVPTQAEAAPTEVPDAATPVAEEKARPSRGRTSRKRAAAPVAVAGQLTVDSNPQGAQVHIDGRTDPSWVTPLSLTNIQPGQHSITVSKAGYSSDTRSVQVNAGAHSSTSVHLSQLSAMLIVKSDPPGADIFIDSRNVGTKTPAQVSVARGQHVVLVRMTGYLDETMSAQFILGQTFNFSPTLRPLGNVDSIRTVGKMSKLFKRGGAADQGTISIRTNPKGAQVAINQHMIEKNTPVDLVVDPGNYEIDITLSGYAPLHKVVNAEKGGKEVIDEALQRQ